MTRQPAMADEADNQAWDRLAAEYLDRFAQYSPVAATQIGDHRFDSQLDQVSPEARDKQRAFLKEMQKRLHEIAADRISRDRLVDYRLLQQKLSASLWRLDELQEWAWNPLTYTRLTGSSIYSLMARDFAPLPRRLAHVTDRLEQFPRFLQQVREVLDVDRVPRVHAETASRQNAGVLSILEHTVLPQADVLPAAERMRLQAAVQVARAEIERHQKWIDQSLVPNATGEFRLGPELYEQKLAHTLQTDLTRQEIRVRAESELARVRGEMYDIARELYAEQYPLTRFPDSPDRPYQQALIRYALEQAYQDVPARDQVVPLARQSLKLTESFIRERRLITLPEDPLEIIVMPEFQRGVSVAYCDSPGALDVGQKTFYAVAPLPQDWTDQQVASFLREYNTRSIHNLTVHEAMPGHFVQLAKANRYDGRLRAVLASGVFIEGWACYTEQMLSEEGFLDRDPLMRLITLKWYLRTITNALMDQAIHVDGMRRAEAMQLMVEDGFQEEREAAGKWTRAQLTSAQLSTYFVGFQEHRDLRRAAEDAWGERFELQQYHDRVLSFGSPPVRFARALLLDEPIPAE